MIRVKMNDTIYCVERIRGNTVLNQIYFYSDKISYTALFETGEKVKELLDQACELGFINFDQENVKWVFKKI